MKKAIFLLIVIFSLFGIISCNKSSADPGSNNPQLSNSFEVTDIRNTVNAQNVGIFKITANYINNTNSYATVSGHIYFGDGESDDILTQIPQLPPNSNSIWEGMCLPHVYPSERAYTVKVVITAYYSNGQVVSSFEKTIYINR